MIRASTFVLAAAVGAVLFAGATPAVAQPRLRPSELAATPEVPTTNFRGRFGMELVLRLLRSSQAEDRLRGLRRAAELGTPESVALLASQAESNASVRADPRALVEVVRALAPHAKEEGPRAALVSVLLVPVSAPSSSPSLRPGDPSDADPASRFELARATAAFALAESGTGAAIEALLAAVRSSGIASGAASSALASSPPATIRGLGPAAALSPALLLAVSRTEDLRAGDVLLLALASSDPRAKSLALVELGKKGDVRALETAKGLVKSPNPGLRMAAVQTLVSLGAKEAPEAVKALLSDEGSAPVGVDLVPNVESDELVKFVAARATTHPVFAERRAAIVALSRCRSVSAAKALGSLVLDKSVESEAAQALGRTTNPHAIPWLIAMLRSPEARRLGARAYVLHVLRGGARIDEADATLRTLAGARDVESRAVGVFARVTLGDASALGYLADKDARVRAAAAMGTRGRTDPELRAELLRRSLSEKDTATRTALLSALSDGDRSGVLPSVLLVDRVESGEPEAPLAAFALARRSKEEPSDKVKSLVVSRTSLLQTQALLGLAQSEAHDASGRLAGSYTYEPDPAKRALLVSALALRTRDHAAKIRTETLSTAARLDPSPHVRFLARRALLGLAVPTTQGEADEVAWLRITGPDGRAPLESGHTGLLVTSTGEPIPIAFDPDGYALVPAIPPGDTRLLLAPRFAPEPPRQ